MGLLPSVGLIGGLSEAAGKKDMSDLHVRVQKDGCDTRLDGEKQISEEINKHGNFGKLG